MNAGLGCLMSCLTLNGLHGMELPQNCSGTGHSYISAFGRTVDV